MRYNKRPTFVIFLYTHKLICMAGAIAIFQGDGYRRETISSYQICLASAVYGVVNVAFN